MISIDEFKKSLGKTASELTEEQIFKLRENQDKMAEIFFAMWIKMIKDKQGGGIITLT